MWIINIYIYIIMIDTVKKIFFEPRVAFSIFVIFIVVYLIVLDEEGAFT